MPFPPGYIGALPEVPNPADQQLGGQVFGSSVAQVDFTKEFLIDESMPNVNQGSSNTCVAQSFSYYHGFLAGRQFSVHDLYSRIFLPGAGGAYISTGGYQITANGQSLESQDPDPTPETESNMRALGTSADERQFIESSTAFVPNDIVSMASAVVQYNGIVFGLTGSNPGFENMLDPRPPKIGEATWGHCVWAKGYCVRNGKRALICKSSLPESPTHYISEDFFTSGNTFAGLALIPKKDMQIVLQNLNGEIRLVCKFATIEQLNAFAAVYGLDPNVISEQVALKA